MGSLTSLWWSYWPGFMICLRNVLVWGGGRLINRADELCRELLGSGPRANDRENRGARARPIKGKNIEGFKKKKKKKVDAKSSESIR